MSTLAEVRPHLARPVPLYQSHERLFLWTVILGSRVLTDRDKLLVEMLFRLDKPTVKHPIGGLFASATTMADDLGNGWCERTVRRRLAKLQRAGVAVRTGQTSGTRWFVRVPADVLSCCPSRGASAERYHVARIVARDRLDAAILERVGTR